MARPLRFLSRENALVEVTTRAIQGRFLLRPSAALNDVFVGILGRALKAHDGLLLHAVAHVSNHYHLLLTVTDSGALASFMGFVNGNLAREAGRLHDWSEKFWGRRYRSIEILDEDASVKRLRYLLAHGVKEGLVTNCLDWTGLNSAQALLTGEPLRGTWYDRTLAYEARRRGLDPGAVEFSVPYEVELAPLPAWRDLTPGQRHDLVARLVTEIEQEASASRERPPLGVARVATSNPQSRPPKTARSAAPPCHTTSSERRACFRNTYRAFVRIFRDAARGRGMREPMTRYPRGCFPPADAFIPRLTSPLNAAAPAPT